MRRFQYLQGAELNLFVFKLGTAAGSQKSTGIADASGDGVGIERDKFVIKEALVSVANAKDFQPLVESRSGDGTDGRVHAGGIPARCHYCDAFHFADSALAGRKSESNHINGI